MDLPSRARGVRMLVLDVDGVLTDGSLYYGPQGEALKRFHTRDGHGLGLIRAAGIEVAILSARTASMVEARARDLGIGIVFQGEADKGKGLDKLLQRTGFTEDAIGYIGDDVNDLPVLVRARLAACPSDAHPRVRAAVHHVCAAPGGAGAVREVCELLLEARGVPETDR